MKNMTGKFIEEKNKAQQLILKRNIYYERYKRYFKRDLSPVDGQWLTI